MARENTEKETWTTWEELLLACAVKRHGLKDWDSVAMELQNRSALPLFLTARNCKNKYDDLKRRFMDNTNDEHRITEGGDEADCIPWLEELRKLRVAELKQEVHRYDLSIQSLQLKVKRLEEERERSSKENENGDEKPDLAKDFEEERSENDKKDVNATPDETSPENVAGKSVSGKESDGQSQSFNESNSTENRETGAKDEGREPPERVETGIVKPDPALSGSKQAGEDSYNDSSDTIAKHAPSKPSQEKKVGDSAELRDSAAESKEGTKESSDVQSSASLTRTKHQNREASGGSSGSDEPVVSPATTKRDSIQSEPLAGLLDIIGSHKHGSMFVRRLESQKSDKYKSIVRQHVDLETVQSRLDDGSYSSCNSKFYRDLLLMFHNAIVFFPKASPESVAAYELRDLVLKEMKKNTTRKSDPSPEPAPSLPKLLQPKPEPERSNSLLDKHKSAPPIVVVCRKRSSISAKASTTNNAEKQTNGKDAFDSKPPVKSPPRLNEEQSPTKTTIKEKPVTGTRSLRRGNKSLANRTPNENQTTNPTSNTDKGETSKSEKKKTDVAASAKKQGAADFLKRIKKNSTAKATPSETLKNSGSDANNRSRRSEQKKKGDERRDGASKRSGGGKQAKEEISPSKRSVGRPPKKGRDAVPAKRGREGGEAEVTSRRPQKRSRR
ncbi:hypothetical protein F0562_018666 [Nyssa sinensis]|uniref:Bromo domain-containing protein n=1 Tax=Nyssa sinensis TaxID=561372 RepID=A0A5J4ZAA5_9ASTE|nr:hypothetical protein F0562_018666 [Nyssa sinensis]